MDCPEDWVTIELELEEDVAQYLKEIRDKDGFVELDFPIGEDGALVPVKMYLEIGE